MPVIYSQEFKDNLAAKFTRNPEPGSREFRNFVCSLEYAKARGRIEKWLDEFPAILESKDAMRRFPLAESYRQAIAELVVGIAAKRSGYDPKFSPSIGGKTPDWLVQVNGSDVLLEVTTLSPSKIRQAIQNKIHALQIALLKLHCDLSLVLDCANAQAISDYSQSDQKGVVETVDRWLQSGPSLGERLDVQGFLFRIEDRTAVPRPTRVRVEHLSFHSDPTLLQRAIAEKVKWYRNTIGDGCHPFWVALEVIDGHGMDREILDQILSGRRFALSKKETSRGSAYIRRILSDQNRGVFESFPELSGIVWMETDMMHNEWILIPIENPFASLPTPGVFKEVRILEQILPASNHEPLTIGERSMRYFLVFWVADLVPTPGGPVTSYGQRSYMSETFLGRDELESDLLKTNPEYESVTIWNLMELTYEDYSIWTSKDRRRLEARYEFDELIVYD